MKNNNKITANSKIEKFLFYIVNIILILPIILLPPTFKPSDFTRINLLKIILVATFCFIYYRFFYKKDITIKVFSKSNPVFWVLISLGALAISMALSVFFSVDIRFSTFGDPMRAGGIINILFYFVFSIFLLFFITKPEYWKKLLYTNLAIGVLASLFAIVQYFGILGDTFVSFTTGGTPSFMGNSTFLAIYLLFSSFLAFTLMIQNKEKSQKIIFALLVALFLFTILISGSRATYFAIIFGFAFFFFFYPAKLKLLKLSGVFIIAIAIAVILFFNIYPGLSQKQGAWGTVASRLSLQRISQDFFGNRLLSWQITWQAIKEKPIFGWGPENFYIGFEKYYAPLDQSLQKAWWDKPHNIFLDIWVNYGIFTFLLYIFFWVFIIYKLQKSKYTSQDRKRIIMIHGIQAMFIGYLIALFFNFDSFPTLFISFFFIGYSLHLLSTEGENKEIIFQSKNFLSKKPTAIIFIVILTIFGFLGCLKPLYLNEQIAYAENLIKQNKCDKSISTIDYVWQNAGILKSYAGFSYADFLKNCGGRDNSEIKYSQKAMEVLQTSIKLRPNYSRAWIYMGSFKNVLAAREEKPENVNAKALEARSYLQKALELSPKRQEIYDEFGKNYLLIKDYIGLEQIAKDCIKIDSSQGMCYWYLGVAQIFQGKQEEGKQNIEESKIKKYEDPSYVQLGVAYLSQKNYKDAFYVYDILTKQYESNTGHHAVMALLAENQGDYQRAAYEALYVFKLEPENQEAVTFLENLFNKNSNNPKVVNAMIYVYQELANRKIPGMLENLRDIYIMQISKDYSNASYHKELAIVYKNLQNYKLAEQEANIALALNINYKDWAKEFLEHLED